MSSMYSVRRRGRSLAAIAGLISVTIALAACGTAATAHRTQSASSSTAAPRVHMPADQAAHSVPIEWWYIVGHMRHGARRFGYEVTVFKLRHVRPPGFATPIDIYRTDVAITDQAANRFLHRIQYFFPQSASVSGRVLAVKVGNARLLGATPRNMHLRAGFARNLIDLNLASQRPAMDVGGTGYLPMGNGYTYYYSLTDLAARGAITVSGTRYTVDGISWLDHQWGNWSWTSIRGWTWMALQLNNGVQLSLFDFHSSAGRVTGISALLKNGRLRAFRGGLTITPIGTWHSPHTGATYPSGWTVRIPSLLAVFHIHPTVRDQEMTSPQMMRASYWEGSTDVTGTFGGKPVTGQAYTELTGFAGSHVTG